MGQNEKITSGTKNYLGYMASVLTEKNLSHQKKNLLRKKSERGKNQRKFTETSQQN